MWSVIELCATIIEVFLQEYCLRRIFGDKYGRVVSNIAFASIIIIHTLLVTINDIFTMSYSSFVNVYIAEFVYLALNILYSLFFLRGKAPTKIFVSFLIEVIIILASLISFSMLRFVFDLNFRDLLFAQNMQRLSSLVFTKLILLYGVMLLIKIFRRKESNFRASEWIFIASVLLCTVIIGIAALHFMQIIKVDAVSFICIISLFASTIVVNILTVTLMNRISVKNQELYNLKVHRFVAEQELEEIDLMKDQYNNMRKLKHDYKNFVECSITLLDENKYDEARDYMSQGLANVVEKTKNYVNIDNSAISAVINNKFALCEKKNINVKCSIVANLNLYNTIDLSVILFNLLDNAIEAEKNVKEPYIELLIKNVNDYLFVKVGNHIEESVLKNNRNLVTSKENKDLHGIGTKRVKEMVEKNNGFLEYYEVENEFICEIMLQKSTE